MITLIAVISVQIFHSPVNYCLPRESQSLVALQDSTADWGYIHVLGGDSFIGRADEDAHTSGGGYMNDVWVSEGATWELYNEGSKPIAKSTMSWRQVNPGRLPPAGVTYEEWIVCQASKTGCKETWRVRRAPGA